jgi:hypothetical protein
MADAKRTSRRNGTKRVNNQQDSRSESENGKGKENEVVDSGGEWENARPSRGQQQRLKISDVRRAPKKPQQPLHEAPEFFPPAEKFSEKFSTRPSRGGGKKPKNSQPWLSEQDQVTELGARLQKLDARKGLGTAYDGYVPRNPLVSQ